MDHKRSFSAPTYLDLSSLSQPPYTYPSFRLAEVRKWFETERDRQIPHFLKPTVSSLRKAQEKYTSHKEAFSAVISPASRNTRFPPKGLMMPQAEKRKREEEPARGEKRVKVARKPIAEE